YKNAVHGKSADGRGAWKFWHGSASETTIPVDKPNDDAAVADYDFIEVLIQKVGMSNFPTVNIGQIGQTLQNCQQKMEVITDIVVKQRPTLSENLLSLISAVHDSFEEISHAANSMENSLNGIVGCVDLAVLDVQIALQVLVEAFISNCDILVDSEIRSDEAIESAVFCLASATRNLLVSMSDLVEKMLISTEAFDANIVTGLQMVLQTVLNIMDRVLYSLHRITVTDSDNVVPIFEKFSLIIQRLAGQRISLNTTISSMILAPISEIIDSLKSNIQQLPVMRTKNIDSVAMALKNVEEITHEENIHTSIATILKALPLMLAEVSQAIHSVQGITDAVTYSIDVALQNLLATVKCLTFYIAIVTKMLPNVVTTEIGGNMQSMLCFIASSVQTMVDGITLAVERSLTNVICLPPTLDKLVLDARLKELQEVMEPIIVTLENVIRNSVQLVRNILSLTACAFGEITPDLVKDLNAMINNLQRIVEEIMKSALKPTESNEIAEETVLLSTTVMNDENIFSICVKSFEEVARNGVKLRIYFNNSIDQIRKYLIKM
ncbi:hypothetical protein Bhyg_14851, partial [Pseudolycoriella hygida]